MKQSKKLLNSFEKTSNLEKAHKASKVLKTVFKNSLKLNPEENLTIFSDSGVGNNKIAPTLSYSYYLAANEMGLKPEIVMQTPKDRVREVSPDVLNKLRNMPDKSNIMVVSSNRLGTLNGLGKSFRSFCALNKHRFTSASSLGFISMNHFDTIVNSHNINYNSMKKKQEKLKLKLDTADEAHISTKAGTDVFLDIKAAKSVYNHGIYDTKGKGGNLPAGEIYIPINKRSAFGKVVIDASSRQKEKTVLCEKNPITLYVDGGEVKKIYGGKEARGLEKTYEWAARRAKFPWGIKLLGELGIGLNENAKIIGSTLIDEKVKGTAHIATGSNGWFGGKIYAIVHLDQVFKNPTIRLDGKKLNI